MIWRGRGTVRSIVLDVIQTIVGYGINVLWFLSTLFLAKIVFFYVNKKIFCKNKVIGVVIVLLVGMGMIGIVEPVLTFFTNDTMGNIMKWTLIAVTRPLVAMVFIMFGLLWFNVFEKIKDNEHIWGLSFLLILNIFAMVMKNKITLVNLISDPWYIVFITGISGTISLLAMSKVFENISCISNFLMYIGKNSMLIMVTHEYLKIREVIQENVMLLVNNYLCSIVVTFVLVIAIEAIICFIYGKYKEGVKNN